jgi:hypothetical protein
VRAVFNDSAMICTMSIDIFKQVKHWLEGWLPSTRILCMANRALVPSQATWTGTFEIKGIKARGTFKVFDSSSRWSFLFGKPMLQAFKALHNYTTDTIQVRDDEHPATLTNQIANPHHMGQATK